MYLKPGIFKHVNCRNSAYPGSKIHRYEVPDDYIHWSKEFLNYLPPFYTASYVNGQIWADPKINDKNFNPKWNLLDGSVNRISYNGPYEIKDARPLNIFGRTGLKGRGILGRWGPNHAADPIVTRWKRNNGEIIINPSTKKRVLEMITIQRRDNDMWAIPGGMVDPGEKVTETLKREFIEEALDNKANREKLDQFFSEGVEIYKGYVDDCRNTDNAWIETVACNFHDETGENVKIFDLSAGDDAKDIKWTECSRTQKLYASHSIMVAEVTKLHDAHCLKN